MHSQLEAVRQVESFLDQHGILHLTIGGIANAIWGQPRTTYDADLKVILGERSATEFVALVGSSFRFRVPDPVGFVRQTYVVPIYAGNEVPVDLVLGFLPYEQQAADRAVTVEYQGVSFHVCTAEDLIIHKAISERPRDWADIEGVLLRQRGKLDQKYIRYWLAEFATALARPILTERYEELLKKTEGLR